MKKVVIIAEAGVNHNGDITIAKQLIDVAAEAGADYVKFQTFKTEELVTVDAKKADYQIKNSIKGEPNTQFEMLKKLELSHSQHIELMDYCKIKNIQFLSTAFDITSIDLLQNLGINLFKIPSGEITNLPYLKKIGGLNKPTILSTGMCVMSEIEEAVNVLVNAGMARSNISILHCTTDYPTAVTDVNLNAMLAIKKQFNLSVGYSDHTLGITVPIAAVAIGAVIIEKHFTLSRNLEGPDHKASLEPNELKNMVLAIRDIELALGSATKTPTSTEINNILIARKSIHINNNLSKGHTITEIDLVMKRPGDGISPMKMNMVIGKQLNKAVFAEYKLSLADLV